MKKAPSLVLAFLLGGGATAVTQSTKDAVEVDPTHHHVILENPKVRVFEVMAERGDKSPMHSHKPLVLVSLGSSLVITLTVLPALVRVAAPRLLGRTVPVSPPTQPPLAA